MENSTMPSYPAVKKILQVYGGLLLFVGIPANLVTIVVLRQGLVTRTTTRMLMMMLAFGDTAVLCTAVLRYWVRWIFSYDIRSLSRFACKGHAFSVGFFSDFAVGTLCVIATERFLLVTFPHRAGAWLTPRTILVGILCFVGCILTKNSALFWLFDLQLDAKSKDNSSMHGSNAVATNRSTVFVCRGTPGMDAYIDAFTQLDFTTYSILPYIILFTCNVSIFCKLRHQRQRLQSKKIPITNGHHDPSEQRGPTKRKPESIVKVLTVLTIIHAVTTLPGSTFILLKIYFRLIENKSVEERKQINLLSDSLLMLVFTNNAINFVAYMASSTPFRENFNKLFVDWWHKSKRTMDDSNSCAVPRRPLLGRPQCQTELKPSEIDQDGIDADDNGNSLPSSAIPLVQVHIQ